MTGTVGSRLGMVTPESTREKQRIAALKRYGTTPEQLAAKEAEAAKRAESPRAQWAKKAWETKRAKAKLKQEH